MLEWSTPISEWVFYWLLIFSLILLGGVPFSEMKRKNKIIWTSIGVVLLLLCPYVRRLEVKDLIYNEGYKLIIDDYRIGTQPYIEVDPDEHLNKYAFSFKVNHENELVYRSRSKSGYPLKIEYLAFKSEDENINTIQEKK